MKYVLHVPNDWKTAWGQIIEATKADSDFRKRYEEYCKYCDKFGTQEKTSFVSLANTVNSQSTFDGISPKSPDLVVLDKDRQPSEEEDPHWANPLHILEAKGRDDAFCDGKNTPRLVVDGEHATNSFRV